jgi:AcrR family transcriptional regulator
MDFYFQIKLNEKLYLRNPEETELGKKIVQHSLILIHKQGFEFLTFKKLALSIGTTEASIYRYFENKHRLLVYIISWYWSWLEYQVIFHTHNINVAEKKLEQVLRILTMGIDDKLSFTHIDKKILRQIVIDEGSKVYLTKHVTTDNKERLFKPYKDLCGRIAEIISGFSSAYRFPRSLASSIVEISHQQAYFMKNLPSLTDSGSAGTSEDTYLFLDNLVHSVLKPSKKK